MIDWMMQASPTLASVSVPASSQAPKKRPSVSSWAQAAGVAIGAASPAIIVADSNRRFMVVLPSRIGCSLRELVKAWWSLGAAHGHRLDDVALEDEEQDHDGQATR